MSIVTQNPQVVEMTDADVQPVILHVDDATKHTLISQWTERGRQLFATRQPLTACANQYERAGYNEALRDWIWAQEWNWSAVEDEAIGEDFSSHPWAY